MLPGFLPARGSFMLDLVCVAMILVSVLMLLSVGLARFGNTIGTGACKLDWR